VRINFNAPINTLSFGHVATNLLHAAFTAGVDVNLFPIGNPDISAYNYSNEFKAWLGSSLNKARKDYRFTDKSFKLWHLNGCENGVGDNRALITFHELSTLTPTEANLANQQLATFVTSRYTEQAFKQTGVSNVRYLPLGFDSIHFKKLDNARSFQSDGNIVFGLFGKWEKRKHTSNVIRSWVEQYGGKQGYKLNLNVFNPHLDPAHNDRLLLDSLNGQRVWNVNPQPFYKTLAELNHCINSCDVVLDMSGGEGFSIPSFTATALGKQAVLSNFSSLADWGPQGGGIMVPAGPMEDAYDGHFFVKGQEFNQGQIAGFNKQGFLDGCAEAVGLAKFGPNAKGAELKREWTWDKTLSKLLE
jgi:hypothetical protein